MIKMQNVKKSFGKTEVLKDISLNINQGEIYGLIGHSGAGKSTLLRCINALEDYNEGSIKVMDKEVKLLSEKGKRELRKELGMIFQGFNLLSRKNVFQNVALPLEVWGYDKAFINKRVNELLEIVGLSEKAKSKPAELSGGQKQRVAIVRTLIMNPEIILFDEPTSALDPEMVNDVLDLIKKLVEKKITIIIVSHEMSFIKECANKIIFLDGGKIEFMGTKEEAFVNCKNKRLKEFLDKTKR